MSLEEALQKMSVNLNWCFEQQIEVIVINHGKGHHSKRNFSVVKQETRKYLKNDKILKEKGYKIIYGESDYPVALAFDEGNTLVVKKDQETEYIGGRKVQEKNLAIFSQDAKKQRKNAKNLRTKR
ncbi:MAG: hypothetical protein LBK69_06415 [Syntrophomonadaceae bacterium]|jgi:hypothetical protein|nr:hypothetical protein [Syntrophomonadaceae bacterium]